MSHRFAFTGLTIKDCCVNTLKCAKTKLKGIRDKLDKNKFSSYKVYKCMVF